MIGEHLPEHEKPGDSNGNRAQRWLSPEFHAKLMQEYSELSKERHEIVSNGVGGTAMHLSETGGDVVEALAPLAMLAAPESLAAEVIAFDTVAAGSPYDKKKNQAPYSEEELKRVA